MLDAAWPTRIEIRPATPGDLTLVRAMHEAMSPENGYRRFFSLSKLSAGREAERVCRAPAPDHAALLALRGSELVGAGTYEVTTEGSTAEVALAVADDMHGRGVGTLLLEHLGSAACRQGVRTFTGPVLAENAEMLKVFAGAGLTARRQMDDGVLGQVMHRGPPKDLARMTQGLCRQVRFRADSERVVLQR